MHLIRLTPEQVSSYWPLLQIALEEAVPPTMRMSDALCVNVLQKLMATRMQAWAAYEKIGRGLVGFCITELQPNEVDGSKTLLIFCAYVFGELRIEEFGACLETLKKFAKSEGCRSLTYYSLNETVVGLTKHLGFSTGYTYGVVDV